MSDSTKDVAQQLSDMLLAWAKQDETPPPKKEGKGE